MEKCKSEKSDKTEMMKNDQKKCQKSTLPKNPKMSLKWPKSTLCEIRAAWSGVF